MSNIPFSAVTSLMTIGSVQQQAAVSHHSVVQAAERNRRLLDQQNAEHAQEVEDPANQQVSAAGDRERQRKDRGKQRKQGETVEISGLDLDAAAAEAKPDPAAGQSTLDIEA